MGAIGSIVAGVFILYLLLSQVSEYRTLKSETQVMLDHYSHFNGGGMDDEDTLQINFNLSFPHLSCEYASVDATNFMGTHDAGLAARVSKIHLDRRGRQLAPYKDRKDQKHETDATVKGPDKVMQLTTENFGAQITSHEIVVINFATPWCHWCQKLEPVWTNAATKLSTLHPDDDRIILAKVDCTSNNAESLCTNLKIDAFPTIIVMRRDHESTKHVARMAGKDTNEDPPGKQRVVSKAWGEASQERYHGERTVPAIVDWVNELWKQVKSEVPKSQVIDVDKDGEKDSHIGVGCMVSARPESETRNPKPETLKDSRRWLHDQPHLHFLVSTPLSCLCVHPIRNFVCVFAR